MSEQDKKVIGRAELVTFTELEVADVPARVDTGAKTSAVWASSVHVQDDLLEVVLFDPSSDHYTGKTLQFKQFEPVIVASSSGHTQQRYKIRLLVRIKGKKVRAWFTLADRSSQVYPVLIGRNVLLGKFVVDVKKGKPLTTAERERSAQLQSEITDTSEGETA
jgi:hypothetical protein